ncbi:MAG: hypothetical protein Q4C72_01455 [Eubacteriales bacterium]|nr:hypothetical protein [Eubacteriales bacterium]
MKRSIAVLALFALFLPGCAQQVDVAVPKAEEAPPVNPQSQALTRAEQAGLLEESDPSGMTEDEARGLLAEAIDETQYTIDLTDETLSVGKDDAAHEYYVFAVGDAAGEPVGKVAVDRETGEKYNYLGDGVLDEYATFPLYDPAADAACDWEGAYAGPALMELEILQGDADSFTYLFSDGTVGEAVISGNTAKSADGEINFLFAEDIVTVAGGGLTGNYTPQPADPAGSAAEEE